MKNEFVSPEQALALQEIDFDEPCLAYWNFYTNALNYNSYPRTFSSEDVIQLPLKQQVFRWFRKRKMLGEITTIDDWNFWSFQIILEDTMSAFFIAHVDSHEYSAYEEAEIACINKLIEIAKTLPKNRAINTATN
jgi:hypothetical protein